LGIPKVEDECLLGLIDFVSVSLMVDHGSELFELTVVVHFSRVTGGTATRWATTPALHWDPRDLDRSSDDAALLLGLLDRLLEKSILLHPV
jgi:hypothetical protein